MAQCFEDDLLSHFTSAAEYLQFLVPTLEQNQLLQFYGFYKQATIGKCGTTKPGWYAFEARKKWEAWKALGDMSKEEAMKKYIALLTDIKPNWESDNKSRESRDGFAVVSRLANDEHILEESEKNVFDWVKDGNVTKVIEEKNKFDVDTKDEFGMGLIHWASDRGNSDMVRCLIDLKADINLRDDTGQTALHYASACEHLEVVQLLLSCGASPSIKCQEGLLPMDVASNENIKVVLQSVLDS